MDKNTISDLMLKDHEKIVSNLLNVEKDGHPNIEKFLEFEWHLNKHIFIEEKAIFLSFQLMDIKKDEKIFDRLSNEHTAIMNLIENILEESFPKGNTNFNKLKKLLVSHKKFEEKEIYPLLERQLEDKQKNEIIGRINEVID